MLSCSYAPRKSQLCGRNSYSNGRNLNPKVLSIYTRDPRWRCLRSRSGSIASGEAAAGERESAGLPNRWVRRVDSSWHGVVQASPLYQETAVDVETRLLGVTTGRAQECLRLIDIFRCPDAQDISNNKDPMPQTLAVLCRIL